MWAAVRHESFANKLERVSVFLKQRDHHQVLDTELNIVQKRGVFWSLLALLKPFFRLVGIDVYSHVRVHNVAKSILSECRLSRYEFHHKPLLARMIKAEIFDLLNRRTGQKYEKEIEKVSKQLDSLVNIPSIEVKPLKWPNKLSDIEVDRSEKEAIDEFVSVMLKDPLRYRVEFAKKGTVAARIRTLRLFDAYQWSGERLLREASIPHSLRIEHVGRKLNTFILLTKKILGEGAETKVRLAYDLLAGEKLAKKSTTDEVQQYVVKQLQLKRPQGLVPVLRTERVDERFQFFEACYDQTLREVLQVRSLILPEKKKIMHSLLQGLSHLHEIKHNGLSYSVMRRTPGGKSPHSAFWGIHSSWWRHKLEHTGRFSISNGDLKPANILIKNGTEAVITDFGFSNPLEWGGTVLYRAPEQAKIDYNYKAKEGVECKVKKGCQSDVWAMGIVCCHILSSIATFPLPSVQDAINLAAKELKHIDNPGLSLAKYISKIEQDRIDQDLAALKTNSLMTSDVRGCLEIDPLWDIVQTMLQVDPSKRISAAEALRNLEKIKVAF